MNFIEELQWRGMIQDIMPGTEAFLLENKSVGYIGFDPTADSLHIGSLATIMILVQFQKAGHLPIALCGGATGMVGDPTGKSDERELLTEEVLNKNVNGIYKQLEYILKKTGGENAQFRMVNNYDWMKEFSFLDFIRDVGKHMTVNYMAAKDSVKKRMETGISFTEFTYQLLQGYDFLHLHKEYDCVIQMGGSDQWGNITTGAELVRRMLGKKVYACTTPLITKADGGKFGKSEGGNIWLDPEKTSPYKFYQFWLNQSDEEAAQYIKRFTLLDKETIGTLISEHQADPGRRELQKRLAKEVTVLVHNEVEYERAIAASGILFGKATKENLLSLSEQDIQDVFEGVPKFEISKQDLAQGIEIIDLLAGKTSILSSNGEARRSLKENSISINKEKVGMEHSVTNEDLLKEKYILVQKGKKNYFLVEVG